MRNWRIPAFVSFGKRPFLHEFESGEFFKFFWNAAVQCRRTGRRDPYESCEGACCRVGLLICFDTQTAGLAYYGHGRGGTVPAGGKSRNFFLPRNCAAGVEEYPSAGRVVGGRSVYLVLFRT